MAGKGKQLFNLITFLNEVGNGKKILRPQKKQIIFSQGDAADSLYYILGGKVKLSVVSKSGKEGIVALLSRGDFFGEACLTKKQIRLETATSMEESFIVRIEKGIMIRALHDEPLLSELFMDHLLSRNLRFEEDLADQLFNSSEKRLARTLLLLANIEKENMTEAIAPKVSQETLAEMIGTTRSRVSFFMNKFEKLGLIDKQGGLRVHSSLLNTILKE